MAKIQKITTDQDIRIIQTGNFDEEVEEYVIEIDGKRYDLSYTNHDESGWQGMENARNVVETFARLFSVEIEDERFGDVDD